MDRISKRIRLNVNTGISIGYLYIVSKWPETINMCFLGTKFSDNPFIKISTLYIKVRIVVSAWNICIYTDIYIQAVILPDKIHSAYTLYTVGGEESKNFLF